VQRAVSNSLCPLESGQGRLPEQSSTMSSQCMNNLNIKIIILTLSKMFGYCAQCPGIVIQCPNFLLYARNIYIFNLPAIVTFVTNTQLYNMLSTYILYYIEYLIFIQKDMTQHTNIICNMYTSNVCLQCKGRRVEAPLLQ